MPKIQLSAEEMQLVNNSDWILTKHRVVEKVYALFGELSEQMQAHILLNQPALPDNVLKVSPKISKGEQYERLPYVVLDYPRFFSKEDVFAIRSFFWWGNYFSITLHLKGEFLRHSHHIINKELQEGKWDAFYISSGGNEFNFNLDSQDYTMITDGSAQNYLLEDGMEQPFLKISYRISFAQWDNAGQKLMEIFERLMKVAAAG